MKVIFVTVILFASTLFGGTFNLKTLNNKIVHITDFEGNLVFTDPQYAKQPVLFFFFGTRCPFCAREIPQVIKLVKEGKLNAIGIQAQFPVDDEVLKKFVQQEGFNFDVIASKDGNKLVKYLMKRRMWAGGVPYYVLVDKYGNLEPTDLDAILEKYGK